MTRKEQIKGLYALKEYLMRNPIELEGYKSLPITLIDYAIETLEQEPCDCISRDSAIKALDYDIKCFEFKPGVSKHMDDIAKLLNTIYETQVNNIRALPPATPQEFKSEWQKDHEILKAYSDGANEVLDKIRADLYKLYNDRPSDYNHSQRTELFCEVIKILDKYKAESEEA